MSRSSGPPPGPLVIGGVEVTPGQRARVEIPVARFVTGEWLSLPVEVIHGGSPGPRVWLSGAIHGDELDGVEIIREVLSELNPKKLAGAVLGVPVVNVFGFVAESRYLPDRRDLNRSFPGKSRGSMAARLAHLFMTEVVERCEVGLDFHCGSDDRQNHPHVRGNLDDPMVARLARAFGAPIAVHNKPPKGSLRRAASKEGAQTLVYEAGEAGRFTEAAIAVGVSGTLRCLAALGMIRGSSEPDVPVQQARATHWVRAPRSGICRIEVPLGASVKKGQRLGGVFELLGEKDTRIRAGVDGVVIGRRVNPLVHQGEAVVHLARPG
ncbi:MAG: succinylglutamate desuccinylase/aspartoacylase family protein [Gemmatimonadota bacterium]